MPAVQPTSLAEICRFFVYRSAAHVSSNSYTKVDHDTTLYDIGGNTTGSDRFIAPYTGLYFFSALAGNTAAGATPIFSRLYVNGASTNGLLGSGDSSATAVRSGVSGSIYLTAGDYVEHFFIGGGGSVMDVGRDAAYFMGHLVSIAG